MVNPRYMDSFKSHHSPKVKPQSPTSRGKELKNLAANVVAVLPLSNIDGRAISHTGSNNPSNNRKGEGNYEMI
jgi:hypothetical protein